MKIELIMNMISMLVMITTSNNVGKYRKNNTRLKRRDCPVVNYTKH